MKPFLLPFGGSAFVAGRIHDEIQVCLVISDRVRHAVRPDPTWFMRGVEEAVFQVTFGRPHWRRGL